MYLNSDEVLQDAIEQGLIKFGRRGSNKVAVCCSQSVTVSIEYVFDLYRRANSVNLVEKQNDQPTQAVRKPEEPASAHA